MVVTVGRLAIRRAHEGDSADLADLVGDLGYDVSQDEVRTRLRAVQSCDGHRVFVAVVNGEVAGFCTAFSEKPLKRPRNWSGKPWL